MKTQHLFGRSAEFVVTRYGDYIPFNHILFGLHTEKWSAINRYCFVSGREGKLTFIYSSNNYRGAHDVVDQITANLPEGVELEAIHCPKLDSLDHHKWRYFWKEMPMELAKEL